MFNNKYNHIKYDDVRKVIKNNVPITNKHYLLTKFKLTKMAGNSVVVNVIKEIFRKVDEIIRLIEEYKCGL